MTDNIGWLFPGSSERSGIDPLIDDTFKVNHHEALVREVIQNSIDAYVDPSTPVKVEFELQSWKLSDVPHHQDLVEAIGALIKQRTKTKISKIAEWLTKAKKCLNRPDRLLVLRVSDYQTSGLTGDDYDENSSVHSFLRSEGYSAGTEDRGGSFGFGKKAPFSLSNLRTCFYLSKNIDGELVFAGKAYLPSFRLDSANQDRDKAGTGSYGLIKNQPDESFARSYSIRDTNQLPAKFHRTRQQPGLDIYILGYDREGETSWEDPIMRAVLCHFWGSIHFKKLAVRFKDDLGDKYSKKDFTINYQNLRESFAKQASLSRPDEDVIRAQQYYSAVVDNNKLPNSQGETGFLYRTDNLKHLGHVELYVKNLELDQKFPQDLKIRKVAKMRTPKMLISQNGYGASSVNYSAVFICDNPQGNKFLRELEPARHDSWHFQTPAQKQAQKQMNKFIKDGLSALTPEIKDQAIGVLADLFNLSFVDRSQSSPIVVRSLRVKDSPYKLRLIIRSADKRAIKKTNFKILAEDDNGKLNQIEIASIVDETTGKTIHSTTKGSESVLVNFSVKKDEPRRLLINLVHADHYKLVVRPQREVF